MGHSLRSEREQIVASLRELFTSQSYSDTREECSMSTGVATSASSTWKELYRAALFETDKNQMAERIAKAEWALALRARELFHTGREYLQERQAVDAAIYALHALRRTATSAMGRKRTDGGKAA